MHKIFLLLFVLSLPCQLSVYAEDDYTGELLPVLLGSSCHENVTYHQQIVSKTKWQVGALIALPAATVPEEQISPDLWSGKDAFISSFNMAVGENKQPSVMSSAVISVWTQSFPDRAMIYANFNRAVTTEVSDVACVTGSWSEISGSRRTTNEIEDSGWVRIIQDSVEQNSISDEDISATLGSKLDAINAQPGADTRPNYSYTVTSS